MKVSELKKGKLYKCVLSNQTMLIVESQKQTGEDTTGEKDANGNDIMKPVFESVTAGKLCLMEGDKPQFLFNELHDGQMVAVEA